MHATKAYAAQSATAPLAPYTFQYRDPDPDEIQIAIQYCGVCHSDLHQTRDEWSGAFPTVYPCVPGHEIVGRVVKAGAKVKKFKEGDLAAVGCMVNSCRTCESCQAGFEQYCEVATVFTYNSPDQKHNVITHGGYADTIVLSADFGLRVPKSLDLAATAPLLCAGVTTYSPLRHWKVAKGQKVGVVGLGGLGHMGVKLAHAMGAHVVLFTTSPGKTADALRRGAEEVVVSKNAAEMKKHANSFHFILDTVAAQHDVNPYLQLLRTNGSLVLVGLPSQPLPVSAFNLAAKRRQFGGSFIGGLPETQEMLDFCADHDLVADIEMIPMQKVNEAYERLLKSDVKYRFVIDMKSLG